MLTLCVVLLIAAVARARHDYTFSTGDDAHVASYARVHQKGYPYLPQSTTPIGLPAPAPRRPGQPHPSSHVRVLTTPLRRDVRQLQNFMRTLPRMGAAGMGAAGADAGAAGGAQAARMAPSMARGLMRGARPLEFGGAAAPDSDQMKHKVLDELLPQLLAKFGSLQHAPDEVNRMLPAVALSRMYAAPGGGGMGGAGGARGGGGSQQGRGALLDAQLRSTALPLLLERTALPASTREQLQRAAGGAPAPAPRKVPVGIGAAGGGGAAAVPAAPRFGSPAAAMASAVPPGLAPILQVMRGETGSARELIRSLPKLYSTGAGGSGERSIFMMATDALRSLGGMRAVGGPGTRPLPPSPDAAGLRGSPAAQLYGLITPMVEAQSAQAQVAQLREQLRTGAAAVAANPLEPRIHSDSVPDWLQPE